MAYQADTLKNFLLNLRRNHSEFSSLPIQVVTKIISFLSWPDRIRVERVSRQFSEAAKAVWSLQTKLEIDERLNSFTKLSALLKRCGDQLEEISCRRNFLQQIAAEPIGRMCPKVKRLTFLSGTSLSLTKTILMGRPVNPSQDVITAQTYRFITSFSQLEAVQLLNSTATRQSAADEVVIPRSGRR